MQPFTSATTCFLPDPLTHTRNLPCCCCCCPPAGGSGGQHQQALRRQQPGQGRAAAGRPHPLDRVAAVPGRRLPGAVRRPRGAHRRAPRAGPRGLRLQVSGGGAGGRRGVAGRGVARRGGLRGLWRRGKKGRACHGKSESSEYRYGTVGSKGVESDCRTPEPCLGVRLW